MNAVGPVRRRGKGIVLTAIGAALFGGSVAGISPQLPTLLDRPACVDTVMKAVSSDKPVPGTYACFDADFQTRLARIGIDSDQAFANKVGRSGQYHFLGRTPDGGYVYEYDEPLFPHNSWLIVGTSLGVAWKGVRNGDLSSVWIPFEVSWNELGGKTQLWSSVAMVIYLDPDGKITRIG